MDFGLETIAKSNSEKVKNKPDPDEGKQYHHFIGFR